MQQARWSSHRSSNEGKFRARFAYGSVSVASKAAIIIISGGDWRHHLRIKNQISSPINRKLSANAASGERTTGPRLTKRCAYANGSSSGQREPKRAGRRYGGVTNEVEMRMRAAAWSSRHAAR